MPKRKSAPVPPPPPPPSIKRGSRPMGAADIQARLLAGVVREGHGFDQASTMDQATIGFPRGYVGTRNIAIDRAIGERQGLPLGRITEISGWEASGKSTALDQVIAQCQSDGGLAVLADTERARERDYMERLGVRPESLVMIPGNTVEDFFDQIETIILQVAHQNTLAWVEAMRRHGIRAPDPTLTTHTTYDHASGKDKSGRKKQIGTFRFSSWNRSLAGALAEWQEANGIPKSGTRCAASRALLAPVVLMGTVSESLEALECWERGEYHPCAVAADRPVVIGWDSLASTPAEAEREGTSRDRHVAAAAKVIKQNFRRLVQNLDDEAIGLVIVNQRYEKIDTSPMGQRRGRQSESYGGTGVKFHASIRIELERVGKIWENTKAKTDRQPPIGQIVRCKVNKNKVGAPDVTEEYGLVYGRGADNAYAIYKDLVDRGLISSSAWSRFTDESILGSEEGGNKSWQGTWLGLSNLISDPAYPGLWARLYSLYMDR